MANILSIFNRKERHAALVNFSGSSVQLARLGRLNEKPISVDQLCELRQDDEAAILLWFKENFPARNGTHLSAYCGFHPPGRVISREVVNLRRLKEASYLQSLVCEYAKLPSAAAWQINLLHPADGSLLTAEGTPRAGLLVGMPDAAVREIQPQLLRWGLFPRRLELGTLPLLGGLARHLELNSYPNALVVCEISQKETRAYFLGKDGVHTPAHLPHGLLSIEEIAMKELGAPDLESARRYMEESTDAVRSQGKRLVRVLARHLRPAVDYFEMQTGQRSGALFCAQIPSRLSWIAHALSAAVDLELFTPDYARWLPAVGLEVSESAALSHAWLQPLSLVAQLAPETE
ncbi:MAG: hypothetical protein ABIO94_02885 [Opitutaceae bacterium]